METSDPRGEAARLVSTQRWLALGTVDRSGVPSVTYVPFTTVNGAFGVVVSRLAAHTANLLAQRPASVLLVDDDLQQGDAYTRTRFSVSVEAVPRAHDSAEANAIWSALETRQGATVRVLRTLPDFEAIALQPTSGRIVLGFASAHDLDAGAILGLLP
jgi:heme iron utilization protein